MADAGSRGQPPKKRTYVHVPVSSTPLFLAQGAYYLLMGLWSVLNIESFMAVTGPKTDIWLVKTVGLLLAVVGLAFVIAGFRRKLAVETAILTVGVAGVLAGVEIYYVLAGRISWVYLLDTVVELAFISLWIAVLIRRHPS